ncbi:MAG: hypothetical protein K2Q18_03225 [Bdellovibrionales bacterium]|nr:hypothetical protein [Bdellovibrionales bacterium]
MKNISTTPKTLPSVAAIRNPQSQEATSFDELYLKKDYKAAAQYLLDNKQRFDSGIFHYNLGTVYSKMGDQAAARFHLEKAISDGYINGSSLNNLAVVKSQLQVDDLGTSTSFPDQIVSVATSIPHAGYFSITLALILFFMILVRFGQIQKKWVMAVVFILAITPALFSTFYINNVNYAVALKDAPLYEGPSKIFSEKGMVRAGSKVVLGEFKEGWFYVEFPISLSGWVNKDQIGLY